MSDLAFGDLARRFPLLRQNAVLKSQAADAGAEVTSGRAADAGTHLGGALNQLAALDAAQTRLAGYGRATSLLAVRAEAMAGVLTHVANLSDDLAGQLLQAAGVGDGGQMTAAAQRAQTVFGQFVAAMNTRAGDVTVMAGARPDAPALADAAEILSQARAAVQGANGVAGFEAALDTWLNNPQGFGALYRGGGATAAVAVAPGETLSLDATAADPALRQTVKGMVIAALAGDGPAPAAAALVRRGAEVLAEGAAPRAQLAARVGAAQAQLDEAATRNAAEDSALSLQRNALVGVDGYDAATRLQTAEGQLQTLYAVTARLAKLRLVDYL